MEIKIMIKYNGLKIIRLINIELYSKEIKNNQKLYILKAFKKLRKLEYII